MDLTTSKRTKMKLITVRAPTNIAVIKYWGKRNENLILPLNSSVSVTLSVDQMSAKTSVAISSDFEENKLWLNGKEEDFNNPRIQNCLREFRQILIDKEGSDCPLLKCRIHVCSQNNFPTAAGLASSAAGYACLVFALAKVYGLHDQELTVIARQGSGSACRSLEGGFVKWNVGIQEDGRDSVARQLFAHNHWPELRVLILVVDSSQKQTSSTGGMSQSTRTSSLLPLRCKMVLPERIQDIENAIRRKDFHSFADITMKDSNQFHAICQDTFPPIRYMNDTSWEIVNLIHRYNSFYGSNRVAYTFDAGPNAVLFALEPDILEVASLVTAKFPPPSPESFYVGLQVEQRALSPELLKFMDLIPISGGLKYVIHTKVGGGPEEVHDHLLNEGGLPK